MFLVNGENINSQLGMHLTHFSHLAHDSHPSFSHLWHFGVLQISFDGSSRHGIHGMQGTHLMHSIQSSHPSHASSNPWTKAKLQRQNKVYYKIKETRAFIYKFHFDSNNFNLRLLSSFGSLINRYFVIESFRRTITTKIHFVALKISIE